MAEPYPMDRARMAPRQTVPGLSRFGYHSLPTRF